MYKVLHHMEIGQTMNAFFVVSKHETYTPICSIS